MIVNPINISDLTLSTPYTNLKLSMLQKGLLQSLTINSVNDDGSFDVTLLYNDNQSSDVTMGPDAVVFEVDDELVSDVPID